MGPMPHHDTVFNDSLRRYAARAGHEKKAIVSITLDEIILAFPNLDVKNVLNEQK
jgi:hypothetical protein